MQKRSVLVVDDNQLFVQLTTTVLSRSNSATYATHGAASLQEALALLARERFDLLILDYYLGKETGADVIRSAREQGLLPPVLMVSGSIESSIQDSAYSLGADLFLNKQNIDWSVFERVVRTVIERHHAQRELAERERFFRTVLQGMDDGVCVYSAERRVLFVSPQVRKLATIAPEEVDPGTPFLPIHPDDLSLVQEDFERTRADAAYRGEVTFRYKRPDGTWGWLEARRRNFLDDPAIGGIVTNLREVSDRHRLMRELLMAKEKVEESNRLKDFFLANMSHEIRTPLSGIIGYSDLIQAEASKSDVKGYAASIRRSGRRLLRTLTQLLEYSQSELGQRTPEIERVNLLVAITHIVEDLASLAEMKGVSLEIECDLAAPTISTDRSAVNHIFENLIDNAIKFTSKGGVFVRIAEDKTQNAIVVRVADTGVGISGNALGTIFEPFRQESEGRSRTHEGVGLGLALVKRSADSIRAHIQVESKKGVGSTFSVYLPRA